MTTLEDITRVLGGVVRDEHERSWVETTIGDLRAAVIRRVRPLTGLVVYDVAVFTPYTRELDPFARAVEWRLAGPVEFRPRLGHGYVFAGCRGGVLFATSPDPPTIERLVGVLWQLAAWARQPWQPWPNVDPKVYRAQQRREKWRPRIARLGFVAIVVLLAALLRRIRYIAV